MTTDTGWEDIAIQAARWAAEGHPAALGRVVQLHGFSTWPGGQLVVADGRGAVAGDVLGRHGEPAVTAGAHELLASPSMPIGTALIEIRDEVAVEAGLSCGGRAEVLLQRADQLPAELWDALSRRAPVALATRVEGPGAGPSLVVAADGRSWGSGAPEVQAMLDEAVAVLQSGHSATRRVEDEAGAFIVSAFVPAPRLVVVGSGDLVAAIDAQAGLLGWETRASEVLTEVDDLLEWAAGSASVIVLTHNPHIDAAALQAGLAAGAPYVGAMGSRATQTRRTDRLRTLGVADEEIGRIHRPIGLDLGGRSAPEVALAICAEILAARCGRDGRPLRDRVGSIRGR
jgi:xanthine dehydrogenase accessory factor